MIRVQHLARLSYDADTAVVLSEASLARLSPVTALGLPALAQYLPSCRELEELDESSANQVRACDPGLGTTRIIAPLQIKAG